MIVITGAAGFIGRHLIRELNFRGKTDLFLVENELQEKRSRLKEFKFVDAEDRLNFPSLPKKTECVIHLGARTDTLETDLVKLYALNLEFSMELFRKCAVEGVPFLYASSAATYGDGALGFLDDHSNLENLKPLNPYAFLKHKFDTWAVSQEKVKFWYGLKFFNVYGRNEEYKYKMASMPYKMLLSALKTNHVKLFEDGEQTRDFIYVEDVVKVILFFLEGCFPFGVYNVGSGVSRSFNDLSSVIGNTIGAEIVKDYIQMPSNIRFFFQNSTKADVSKLRGVGFLEDFTSLEDGVKKMYDSF